MKQTKIKEFFRTFWKGKDVLVYCSLLSVLLFGIVDLIKYLSRNGLLTEFFYTAIIVAILTITYFHGKSKTE